MTNSTRHIGSSHIRPHHDSLPSSIGIGLRQPHYQEFCQTRPETGFLEVHAENFLSGGAPTEMLEELAQDYPVSIHAIGLSPGRAGGIDPKHLDLMARLCDRIKPAAISDHMSWSMAEGHAAWSNDLLPLPCTDESLAMMLANVTDIQQRLGRAILIENPSTYLQFDSDNMHEADFLMALTMQSQCGLLIDVNNIMVNAHNHDLDPVDWLSRIDSAVVGEIHIAGHALRQLDADTSIAIDDHGSKTAPDTRVLLDQALQRFGPKPVLLERDSNIPPLAELLAEADELSAILARHKGDAHAA